MNISIRPKRLPFDLAEMALRVAYRFLDEWDETITLFKAEAASYVGHGYNKGIKYKTVEERQTAYNLANRNAVDQLVHMQG